MQARVGFIVAIDCHWVEIKLLKFASRFSTFILISDAELDLLLIFVVVVMILNNELGA